jgi:hypothetical protein
MLLCIYFGSPRMQKLSEVAYCLRIAMIIIWGGYMMNSKQYRIG